MKICSRPCSGTILVGMAEERLESEISECLSKLSDKRLGELPALTPDEIYQGLNSYVIGQDRAKRKIALAAHNHVKRIRYNKENPNNPINKANILLYGPTGCGKTHLARNLARVLDLPIVIVDATDYTEAGYYGKDVETIVGELLIKTGNVEETQQGIVFIDEIDKIATRRGGLRTGAGNRDIGGEGVQQALLKLLEGKTIFAPINVTQHWNRHDFVPVDVSNIFFICAGAFSDLSHYRTNIVKGFSNSRHEEAEYENRISLESFQKYGFMPEFLGRLPVRIGMRALTSEELIEVLTVPPDSILNEYRRLLGIDDISLSVDRDVLAHIVNYAETKKMGARALRTVMEEILEDIMFKAPELKGTAVRLTKRSVQKKIERLEQ